LLLQYSKAEEGFPSSAFLLPDPFPLPFFFCLVEHDAAEAKLLVALARNSLPAVRREQHEGVLIVGIMISDKYDEPSRTNPAVKHLIDEVIHVAVNNAKRSWRTASLPRRIVVSCTDDEYDAILRNSNTVGLSLSRFLAVAGVRELPQITSAERELLLALIFQIKKAGVRLDQLAHAQHSSKFTGEPPPVESETTAAKRAFRASLKLVIERLSCDC
jgi:hypothetical protein